MPQPPCDVMTKLAAALLVAGLLPAARLAAQDPAPEAAPADTNAAAAAPAEPLPPEDPVSNLLARFSFDAGVAPEFLAPGVVLPAVFTRESPAYANGREAAAQAPRLVPGKSGQGLLLESAFANLCAPGQATAEELTAFTALGNAALEHDTAAPWTGTTALRVKTPGETEDSGFATMFTAERALYNGAAIVPAAYVASLYLKGQGNLKLTLAEADGEAAGEPVYVTLNDTWQRAACAFRFAGSSVRLGPKHEADWKASQPAGAPLEARLKLLVTATDSSPVTFLVDGLQLEQRDLAYPATGSGPAPRHWAPPGLRTARETLALETAGASLARWRTNGTISAWFRPNWDARDGTLETILQVPSDKIALQHAQGKLQVQPVGIAFTPSDFAADWRHLVLTWDAEGRFTLYVDGLDYPADELTKRPLKQASSLVFGGAADATAANGILDDLMLFQIALTPAQVQALYNGSLLPPGAAPAPAAPPADTPAAPAAEPPTNAPPSGAAPAETPAPTVPATAAPAPAPAAPETPAPNAAPAAVPAGA